MTIATLQRFGTLTCHANVTFGVFLSCQKEGIEALNLRLEVFVKEREKNKKKRNQNPKRASSEMRKKLDRLDFRHEKSTLLS
jgi:hypothetical protein